MSITRQWIADKIRDFANENDKAPVRACLSASGFSELAADFGKPGNFKNVIVSGVPIVCDPDFEGELRFE